MNFFYYLRCFVTVADHQQQDYFDNDQSGVNALNFDAISGTHLL